MTTAFSLTRTTIAQRVLSKVTKVPNNQSMASVDAELIYQAIDLRLKEMSKRGSFWRKVTEVPVTFSLTGGTRSASAGAGDILWPLMITFNDGDEDAPVAIVGKTEYASIKDKDREGKPQKALWKGGTEFVFYPVPMDDGTANLLYEKIADDTSAGAAIDVDVAMLRPFVDIIKFDVADDYGMDEGIQRRWQAEARQAEIDIRKLNAQRIDLTPVAVDDFDGRSSSTHPGGAYVTSDYVE